MNQALTEISGLFEGARQYAVANNTYVWVVFDDSPHGDEDRLLVATLASKTGIELAPWGTDDTASGSARTRLLSKVRTFKQVKLSGAGVFGSDKISDLPEVPDAGDPGDSDFVLRLPGEGEENFEKAVEFTPSGEARNAATLIGVIEIGLQPTHGRVADADNVAVIRINGLTGQSTIYRP